MTDSANKQEAKEAKKKDYVGLMDPDVRTFWIGATWCVALILSFIIVLCSLFWISEYIPQDHEHEPEHPPHEHEHEHPDHSHNIPDHDHPHSHTLEPYHLGVK